MIDNIGTRDALLSHPSDIFLRFVSFDVPGTTLEDTVVPSGYLILSDYISVILY